MREILFRGKRVDNGEWIEGYLAYGNIIKTVRKCYDWRGDYVCDSLEEHKIDKETVGQYTGLTDKNGKKIFEGDIVQYGEIEDYDWSFCRGVVKFGEGTFDGGIYRYTGFYFEESDDTIDHNSIYKAEEKWEQLKVIGNVFDNPELLEKDNA